MGRGYLERLVQFFFGSGPPWGGALSGRCPAVRAARPDNLSGNMSGRCPAACPAPFWVIFRFSAVPFRWRMGVAWLS